MWSKLFDFVLPPLTALSMAMAYLAGLKYGQQYGWTFAHAAGAASIVGFVMAIAICVVYLTIDRFTKESFGEEAVQALAGAFFAGAASLVVAVSASAPPVVTVACAIAAMFLGLFVWGIVTEDYDETLWIPRALVIPAGVMIALFGDAKYGRGWAEILLLSFCGAYLLWTGFRWSKRQTAPAQ